MTLVRYDTDWAEYLADRIAYWRQVFALHGLLTATADFETRSECPLGGPSGGGARVYSEHPTTKAMCLVYRLPGHERRLWHMAHPQHLIGESPAPLELFAFILAGGLMEAHNSFFERCIWRYVMVERHGWPEVQHLQWRCSAAKASACSLPRALEDAALAMRLDVEKDMVGNRLMKKMCKPRKPLKAERKAWKEEHGKEPMPTLWHEAEEDLYRLWAYCDRDVETEEALSHAVPDLSEDELAVWQMDQELNERGALFDIELAVAALDMAARWKVRLNGELEAMTGVASGTQRAAVKAWLLEHEDLDLPNTAAETLEWYVAHEPISGRARRICEIVMDVNRTSTSKYKSMLNKSVASGRVMDLMMYHGAGTGRWSGKGVQIHNFPARDLIVKDFDYAAECIKSGDIDWCVAMYGDIMRLLSHALRGTIISPEGRDLIVADYSAIEARCVLWLAYAMDALDVFLRGEDIYCDMATGIYGYEVIKGTHPLERQFGKQAILGLGFGMGFVTFLLTCRKHKIHFSKADTLRIMGPELIDKYTNWVRNHLCLDGPPADMDPERAKSYSNKKRQAARVIRRLVDAREVPKDVVHELALMKYTVDVYRSRYPEVKQLWKDQETAAIAAVLSKTGERVPCGRVTWFVEGGFLCCELPSKRLMRYRDPEIKMVRTSWGEERPAIRYMHVNGTTRKWERTATYGGKLVENITQAVARDVMANAMMLAHEGDTYDTIMSIHDELVCEVDEDKGSLDEFESLMSMVPPWAHQCPITAEAERYKRYRK